MNKLVARKMHRDYVLSAIETLELTRSGAITKWVNDKIQSYIDKKFNYTTFPLKSPEELDELKARELEDLAIGQDGVRRILLKLQTEGLIAKNKYDEYVPLYFISKNE